jgi:hypothetical protein
LHKAGVSPSILAGASSSRSTATRSTNIDEPATAIFFVQGGTVSRFHQSRATAHRSRALALTVAAMLACACGDDEGTPDDGDASARPDSATQRSDAGDAAAPRDATVDASRDAATDSAAPVDAGPVDPSVPGEDAPTLTEVFYLREGTAPNEKPVIVIAGRDPNGDVTGYRIKLFKGTNAAEVVINQDGDKGSEIVATIPETDRDMSSATFRYYVLPSNDFLVDAAGTDVNVNRIEVIVTDAGGRPSMMKSAMLETKTITGACDPGGYPRCAANLACIAGTGGKFTCSPVMTARTSACAAPLELHPPAMASVTGVLGTSSLWDPPGSCSPNDPKGYPDRIVKLKLDSAATVEISSNNAGTKFDSVLYKLDSCQMAPAMCTAQPCGFCEDDVVTTGTMTSTRAVLTLNNLPAGDHLLVIDSRGQPDDTGGEFELTATIK